MIYLTFATEAEAVAALYDGDAPRWPGVEILNPVPMPVPSPGYHVNAVCRGQFPAALDPWRVYPATPFAVLA